MSRDLLLCLLSAGLLALALMTTRLGFLAYWALLPALLLFETQPAEPAFRWGFLLGFLVSAATLTAGTLFNYRILVATILLQPLFFALFAMGLVLLRQLLPAGFLLSVPLLWTLMEFARSLALPELQAISLAYTQRYYLSLISYTPAGLGYAVSFWVVAINVTLLALWRNRERLSAVLGLAVLLLVLFMLPFAGSLIWRRAQPVHERIIQVRYHESLARPEAAGPGQWKGTFCIAGDF